MQPKLFLFTRPGFLIGLLLLLVNDFYFKYAYPSFVTGKLSDFAGLFVFPYFFSVFMEKQTKIIYISTALFFIYWKLEISQAFIDNINSLFNSSFHRSVDSTDLIALLILPISHRYFKQEFTIPKKGNLVIHLVIIVISAFSFVATSKARSNPQFELDLSSEKEFIVPYGKEEISRKKPYLVYDESNVSYDFLTIDGTSAVLDIEIEVKEYDKKNTKIILKKFNSFVFDTDKITKTHQEDLIRLLKLTTKDFEKLYEKHLIEEFGSARTLQTK